MAQAEADAFDRQHPVPERPSVDKPSPAKAAAAGSSGGRPAKRTRAAAGGEGDRQEGEEQQQPQREEQPQHGAGLTEMEQQRLELIRRNREVRGRLFPEFHLQHVLPVALPLLLLHDYCSHNSHDSPSLCQNLPPVLLQRMMALNLPGMAADLLPAAPPKQQQPAKHKGARWPAGLPLPDERPHACFMSCSCRPVCHVCRRRLAGVSRKRLSEVLPRRESSRLRGIAADGTMIHAERQGEVRDSPGFPGHANCLPCCALPCAAAQLD